MAQFPPAFAFMMANEDSQYSYAEVQDSNGAGVIAGINQASFPKQFAGIAALPAAQRATPIQAFYVTQFWAPMKLGALESQDLANRLIDAAVNMGAGTAGKLLQEAINGLQPPSGAPLAVDGVVGPATLTAANAANSEALLASFRQQRLLQYQLIATKNPADQKFLGTAEHPGVWWKRATA